MSKNTINKYITLKIRFIPDKILEDFLYKNCAYRHFLYNKAVEYVLKDEYAEDNPNNIFRLSKYDIQTYLRNVGVKLIGI